MVRNTGLFLVIGCTMLSSPAAADEVRLVCTGTQRVVVGKTKDPHTGLSDYIYGNEDAIRQIRFDEDTGEFWYSGAKGLSKKNADGEWIPAASVEFEDAKITATFKRRFGSKEGTLDRVTGVWAISDLTLQCRLYDAEKRLF